MEVIGVRGVVIRAKCDAEIAAGPRVYGVQKARLGAVAFPVFQDAERPAIGERKALDIDGVSGRVLAAKRRKGSAAHDVAAGIDAEMANAADV